MVNSEKDYVAGVPKGNHSIVRFSRRLVLIGILLVFSALVYLARFRTAVQVGVQMDDARYLALAESFVTGRPYRVISYPSEPLETVYPPGYPLFILAPVWLIVGPNYELLRATSFALAIANIALAYVCFRRHVSKPYLLMIVALFALNHAVADGAGRLIPETAFIFFSLAFVYLFESWTSSSRLLNRTSVLAVITLTAAVLVRYQGLALIGAGVLYLLTMREPKRAAGLLLCFILCISPFGLFLVNQRVNPESFRVVQSLTRRVLNPGDITRNWSVTAINYWRTIPRVLVPVLGSRIWATANELGLAWLVDIANSSILIVTALGVWRGLAKRRFAAWYLICYFFLVLNITNRVTDAIYDEPRYTMVVLPFLYLALVQGLLSIGQWLFRNRRRAKAATLIVGSCLLVILLLRNVQQAQVSFPVVDLTVSADWVQANTPRDAVVMCPDPGSRYLYLRRKTVSYPKVDTPPSFVAEIGRHGIDYLIVAPPLTIAYVPNVEQRMSPYQEQVVMPAIANNPAYFALVYHDDFTNTSVYHIRQH